jgi:hypothetical protein
MQKNITFSADEHLIREAREKAHKNKQSLNVVFRLWLEKYVSNQNQTVDYYDLMKQLKHINPGKKFLRDEMNER